MKEENRQISSSRVTAERPISHVKNFAVLGGVFRDNIEETYPYVLIAAGIVNMRILFGDFELWAHMNKMTSPMGIEPIPIPSDELMKTEDAEKQQDQNANNTSGRWPGGAKRPPKPGPLRQPERAPEW